MTIKVTEEGTTDWVISDVINIGYKATNIYDDEGDRIKLEAI